MRDLTRCAYFSPFLAPAAPTRCRGSVAGMKARSKVVLGSIAGAVAIHLVFLACGTPSMNRDSGVRRDAGSTNDVEDDRTASLEDVFGEIADRETGTADAQGMPVPMESRCEAVDGGPYFYAFFNVPQIQASTVPRLRASVCNQSGSLVVLPPGFAASETCIAGTPYWVPGRVAIPCFSTASTVRLVVE